MNYTIDFQKTYNEGKPFLETTVYIVVSTSVPFLLECRDGLNGKKCWNCGARTTDKIDATISVNDVIEDLLDVSRWAKGETKYWKRND